MNKYNVKKFFLIILIVIVTSAVFVSIRTNKVITPIDNITDENITTGEEEPINICYYRSTKTDNDFYNVAWLKLNILGKNISGEFQNLPAESDSKIGIFEGQVEVADQKSMTGTANVWWKSHAEGMEVKEELEIQFGDGSATVGFGEMVDRGDGVYIYKNKNNLYYIEQMNQYDCEYLDEKLFAEKYIRDNISTIATNDAVLGGTWYVVAVTINPTNKSGEVAYEDGHILSNAKLEYIYKNNPQSFTITKFEVIK